MFPPPSHAVLRLTAAMMWMSVTFHECRHKVVGLIGLEILRRQPYRDAFSTGLMIAARDKLVGLFVSVQKIWLSFGSERQHLKVACLRQCNILRKPSMTCRGPEKRGREHYLKIPSSDPDRMSFSKTVPCFETQLFLVHGTVQTFRHGH